MVLGVNASSYFKHHFLLVLIKSAKHLLHKYLELFKGLYIKKNNKEEVKSIGNPAGIGQGTGLGLRERDRDGIGLR